jgi:hypothetical protein
LPGGASPERVETAAEIVDFEAAPGAVASPARAVPAEPAPRSWAELLAGFMEERKGRF